MDVTSSHYRKSGIRARRLLAKHHRGLAQLFVRLIFVRDSSSADETIEGEAGGDVNLSGAGHDRLYGVGRCRHVCF